MKGLYVLLFEIDTIMSRTILEDPKETMFLLMKMEANGTLSSALMFAFGQWYLFPPIITFFAPKYLFFYVCLFFFNDFLLVPICSCRLWWD